MYDASVYTLDNGDMGWWHIENSKNRKKATLTTTASTTFQRNVDYYHFFMIFFGKTHKKANTWLTDWP